LAESNNAAQPAQLGRGWHTTTFKWLSVYGVIFALSVMILIGFIGWSVTADMERDNDSLLRWQLIYFGSVPDKDLSLAIHQRLEQERMHVSYFGLFAPDGSRIAGDILALPTNMPVDSTGHTLHRTLTVAMRTPTPVVRAMAVRRADGSELVIARDLTAILRIREATINALVGGGVFFLLVSIGTGLLLSVRQMRRVRDIRRVTLRIAEGDLNQRLPMGGRDELDMLTHLVNHMLDEIERLMTEVKGACDGIAHDLRTPLAHIRTLLSNSAERTRATGDDKLNQMLDQARRETDMLLERFRAMLRISEIEGLKRRGGFASVDTSALVQELGELYEPLADDRSIRWTVRIDQVQEIHGDRALLFEAFSNLLDNAIKFAPDGGHVQIALTRHARGPLLTISDDGPGIPEGEHAAILTRFYRGDQARHLAGSGLGLSIVTAVMRLHDFTLRIGQNDTLASNGVLAQRGTSMTVECWPHALD